MEELKAKTGKYALQYGVIIGVIGIVFSLMLYSMDLHYQVDIKRLLLNVAMGLLFIVVGSIIAMKAFKKENGGFMSISEGLKIGVGMSLISGIISIIFGFILSKVIDPDMQQKAIEYGTELMRDYGMTEAQIDEQIANQKDPNPVWQIAQGLIFSLIFGFIGSIIPAAVLKKTENLD